MTCVCFARQARSLTLSRHLWGQFRKDAQLFTVSHLEWQISVPLSWLFCSQCCHLACMFLFLSSNVNLKNGVKRVACFYRSPCCTDALLLRVGLVMFRRCLTIVTSCVCLELQLSHVTAGSAGVLWTWGQRISPSVFVTLSHSTWFTLVILFTWCILKCLIYMMGRMATWACQVKGSVKGSNPRNHWTDTETGCVFLHQNLQTLI